MRILLLGLFFSLLVPNGATSIEGSDESDLPVYLKGIGWKNVEAELRKDLRLTPFVRPIHYELFLNISVGDGYKTESTFQGTLFINLNITAPVREIELHSVGLNIVEARMLASNREGTDLEDLNDRKFEMREGRETVAILSKRLINPEEHVSVLIVYSGNARMDGNGLYESWNQPEHPKTSPFISLLTQCEPTMARRWFPCFDEPDKKATFQLSISHPEKFNAFSNTASRSNSTHEGKRVTEFEKTVPLPTYLVAIGITEQPFVELIENGYKFRAIGDKRKEAVNLAAQGLSVLQNHSIFNGVPFIPQKTDILMVDDYISGAMENPGLITFNIGAAENLETHIHELAHMYFGNLVTLSTWGDIWVNEGFASLLQKNMKPTMQPWWPGIHRISLHDSPLHNEKITFTSSIHLDNSFDAHSNINYARGSQFLRMIRKFVGNKVFDRAINKYLLENAYGNGEASKIIKALLNEYYGDRYQLERMLNEWIYQPGVAVVFIKRGEDYAELSQTRFHATYFDEYLRDNRTRFTIPLFCEIDGESKTIVLDSRVPLLQIPLFSNSSFTCENNYGDLFGIWSKPETQADSIQDYILHTQSLVQSGIIDLQQFSDAITPFAGDYARIFKLDTPQENIQVNHDTWTDHYARCLEKGVMNLSNVQIFDAYLKENDVSIILCSNDVEERSSAIKFLSSIISGEWKIRNKQIDEIIEATELLYPGINMEMVLMALKNSEISLPMRTRIHAVIKKVYTHESGIFITKADTTTLRDLICLHPSIAAENYDWILKILEGEYVAAEFNRRYEEMNEIIKNIIGSNYVPKISASEGEPVLKFDDKLFRLI